MNKDKILFKLFDKKTLTMLRFFLLYPNERFYLREISKKTKISVASTHRLLQRFTEAKIILTIENKNSKLYILNDDENTKYLKNFLKPETDSVKSFVDLIKESDGLISIISHGKITEKKANLLLIGNDIDQEKIKEAARSIKENQKFTILYVTLTQEQYQQMSMMGLYPGTKKNLWTKE